MCYDKINIELVIKEKPTQDISTNATSITILDNINPNPNIITANTYRPPSPLYHHVANFLYSTKYCRQKYVIISCFTITLVTMIYFLIQITNGLNDANLPLLTRSMDGINNKLSSLEKLSIYLGTLNNKLEQFPNATSIMNENFKLNGYSISSASTSTSTSNMINNNYGQSLPLP